MIPDKWQEYLAASKRERDDARLSRKLRPIRHLGATRIQLGTKELVNFASNDYLGLAGDLRIAEAVARAAGRFGWGAGASRLVTGTTTLHHRLELETARFRGTEAALLFGSGYQANLGVITALVGEGDTILSDSLNHSSILAACRLSRAKVKVFKHLDYDDLERKLNNATKLQGKKIIVTDTLFSITGDEAELPRIIKLCERFDALLVVDDAHGNAALGKRGRGIVELQHAQKGVAITVATYSKALGSYGGFVACSNEIKSHLINHSKQFIYTTSLPLALVAANTEALAIVRKDGDSLRQKLQNNFKLLRSKLQSSGFEVGGERHILSIKFHEPERALFVADQVEQQGAMIYPMRFPSVPYGQDAVRISVSAAHSDEEIFKLVNVLQIARDRLVGKDTTGVNRRTPKRPTHATLGSHEEPQTIESGGFMAVDDMLDNQMSAADSSRLPAADEVSDFQIPEVHDSGATMIEQPALAPFASGETLKLIKDIDKEDTRKFLGGTETEDLADSDKEETSKIVGTNERVTQTLPIDDDPTGSGKTLSPEPMELKDPVIDKIEGGTKRRKKKRGRNKTKAKKK
ncbi:MAG: 8-amino-7-oxononanoate synthase [Planctomycetota bacterium]